MADAGKGRRLNCQQRDVLAGRTFYHLSPKGRLRRLENGKRSLRFMSSNVKQKRESVVIVLDNAPAEGLFEEGIKCFFLP